MKGLLFLLTFGAGRGVGGDVYRPTPRPTRLLSPRPTRLLSPRPTLFPPTPHPVRERRCAFVLQSVRECPDSATVRTLRSCDDAQLKLGKLCVLYDDNDITIDGGTNLSFTEDVAKRFEAYGWHVQAVTDGNSTDTGSLEAAIAAARAVTDKPSLIKVKTIIGLGSAKQGTHSVHGAPLGAEDLAQVKTRYGFDPEATFAVPDAVREFYAGKVSQGQAHVAEWNAVLAAYESAHPAATAEFKRRCCAGALPSGWKDVLPRYTAGTSADKASRNYSQDVINGKARRR